MSKQPDYKKSPALAFISSAQPAEQVNDTQEAAKAPELPKHKQVNELSAEEITALITAGKISPEEITKYIQKINPNTKSRRVQLVLKPHVYQQAKNKADELHKSFNEFIETLILDYLDRN